ncbi:MAG TPA: hypothetical protein VNU97_10955 [Rhizomicrobium sp.]|jgi:hypothetical protein|nr:hypothetical protein [Rhizomicrobium sp.]
MTAFRNSLALAAVLALAGAASGQSAPPPAATGAPTPLGSATAPPADAPPAPQSAPVEFKPGILGKVTQTGVTEGDLGVVDGPPVGTLGDSQGGLGQSMWINAPRGEVEDLLGRVPLVSADPFVRGLARRVVLTVSDAPVGPARRALVTIRIEKLLQAGLLDDAGALAAALKLDNDPDFARVQAEALLYAGRDKEVCGDLTATRLTAPEPFWLELRTWCFAAGGDSASAELTHAVLEAQGAKDPAFDLLSADALGGRKTAPGAIDRPNALHVYLLRKTGLPVTGATAARLGTAANLLAARETRNPPADRLAAAARIAATGALTSAELLAILNAQATPADQLAQPEATAAKLTFLPAQSLLRRAATLESRPQQRLDLLLAALSADGHRDRLPLAAALQGDLALGIKPDPTMARGRFALARALLLNGNADAASAWYGGAPDGTELRVFQVLVDLASPNAARDAAAQAALAWFAANAAPQQNPAPLAALALGLSDVLGKPMPPPARALAATLEGMRWNAAARRPSDADLKKLEEAASQPGRKGEVVLRVLDIVGANGPSDLPADVTIECVRILYQAGLAAEAKALAVEALALQAPPP